MAFYSIHSVWTWINPYRLNYDSPYPVGKSVRDYFTQDVVGGVDIGLDQPSIAGTEQAAPDTLACILLVLANRLLVEEGTLAGVTFFGDDDLNPDECGFVGEQVDELGMGQEDKVLVGTLAEPDLLLPAIILADDQRPDALREQRLDHQAATTVEFGLDPPIALVGDHLQLPGGMLTCLETTLQVSALLIVTLIDRLEWSSANQKRDKARLV